jgi:hypothetical protein
MEEYYLTKYEIVRDYPDITVGFIEYWFKEYPVPKEAAKSLLEKTREDRTHKAAMFRQSSI